MKSLVENYFNAIENVDKIESHILNYQRVLSTKKDKFSMVTVYLEDEDQLRYFSTYLSDPGKYRFDAHLDSFEILSLHDNYFRVKLLFNWYGSMSSSGTETFRVEVPYDEKDFDSFSDAAIEKFNKYQQEHSAILAHDSALINLYSEHGD